MPVLKGLSLHISPGETVALVGRSGCGKSTLLSLITRLHDPTRGSILLDGIEIKDLDQDSLRGNIGMVTQMPYLFNMSIRDNFAIVKKDVTDEEIVAACKTACIHDDIMNFSEGYDTVIGEGGILISGGQRQRIAIARCLIGDYPILFLDEATSALDNETQAKIQKAIEGMHGKTIIMIAHRLSTECFSQSTFSPWKPIPEDEHTFSTTSSKASEPPCSARLSSRNLSIRHTSLTRQALPSPHRQ